jgi:hypothetical protein
MHTARQWGLDQNPPILSYSKQKKDMNKQNQVYGFLLIGFGHETEQHIRKANVAAVFDPQESVRTGPRGGRCIVAIFSYTRIMRTYTPDLKIK